MKRFRKSFCIIFLCFLLSFFTLVYAAFLGKLDNFMTPVTDLLSEHAVFVRIAPPVVDSDDDEPLIGDVNDLCYDDIYRFVIRHPEATFIHLGNFESCLEIYTPDISPLSGKYLLRSGSGLTQSDISDGSCNALLSEEELPFARDGDDGLVYSHKGADYKVVGVISGSWYDNIIPLLTVLRGNTSPVSTGFYVDAGENTDALCRELADYVTQCGSTAHLNIRTVEDASTEGRIVNTPFFIAVEAILIFIVLLSMGTVATQWVDTRKRELFVRLLSGAQKQKAVLRLSSDFCLVSLCACVAGDILALALISLGIFGLYGGNLLSIYTVAAIIIQLVLVSIGTADVYIRLSGMTKKAISDLRR